MPSSSGCRLPSRPASASASASTVLAGNASGYYDFKVDAYSLVMGIGVSVESSPFSVGGYRWRISFYPSGELGARPVEPVLYLSLDERVAEPVTAQFEFGFMAEVRPTFFRFQGRERMEKVRSLPAMVGKFGRPFVSRGCKFPFLGDILEQCASKDRSLTVRCDIVVVASETASPASAAAFVSVPPSDLHRHLGDLLRSEKGADVAFQVGAETFAAHRCVLAARSPVFSAELLGAMKEGSTVRVDGMEAPVFGALLCFVYTDSLPEMREDEDEGAMYEHLLVAADRYGVERLKLVCEEKLCGFLDVGRAAAILTLAEQHHCDGLKKACFSFVRDPANLRAVVASDGFEHLSRSCPSIKNDLMSMLGP